MQRSAKPADLKASPFIPFRYQQTLIKTLIDRINKNSCHRACPDSIGEPASSTEAKEHTSERSPERKRENPEAPSPDRKRENPESPPPDRKHENQPFIIQKSSSTGATSAVLLVYLWYFLFKENSNFLIMTPNIFDLYMPKLSNYAKIPVFNFLMFVIKHLPEGLRQEETKEHASSCHLEPVSPEDTKERTSERSPDRKHENEQSPSPERKCENEQSPSGKRKASSCFFIPGTRIKFVINRKTHFYCYLENTTNGNRIVGLSAGTKRDIAEILNSLPAPPSNSQLPIAEQYNTVSLSTFFPKESGKKTSMKSTNSQSPFPESNTTSSQPPSFTSILLDDHAFHAHADHHYLQLSKLTSSIISVSSPNGQSNLFYELADMAKKEDLFILHWIHNPLYDRAWYDTLIQTASAGFVEQFVNQQFAYRYKNNHKRPSPPLTPNNPIAEQYVKVSLSTFFSKESEKKTSMKPANTKTPEKKTTIKPANTKTPQEKAAFKHDTPTSATPKPKRPPIISALTGNIRTRVKTMAAITYNTYYDVRNHISKSHKANLSQPFVPYEDYNEKTIVQSWNRLNRLIANRANMVLASGEKAVSLVNKYSYVPVSQSLIVTSEPDRKLRYEFRVLFFNDGFVKNYYRKLLENRRRIEAAEKKRIEDEKLEKEVEEYNRQFREKYDKLNRKHASSSHLEPANPTEARKYASERSPYRKHENPQPPPPEPNEVYEQFDMKSRIHNPDMMESELINDLAGLPSDFTIDQLVYIRFLLRDYSILKAEKRNRMAREDRERYPAIYEAMQKPRPKRDKYYPCTIPWDVIFPDGYRSDRYPDIDYTPPQHEFKPSKENEEEWSRSRVIHELWEKKFMREDGRLYPRTIDWDVTFTKPTESCHLEPVNQTEAKKHASERSPDRKQENPESPSHERKHKNKQQPSNSGHRACPDSIGEPANQSESSHLEPVNQTGAKKYTSERSPERKRENPQPQPGSDQRESHGGDQRERRGGSPSEVQGDHAPPPLPADINERPNCPPEIEYCPLSSDHHIPCYPECPHGMIHNYNRYMREEEAKRIQEKEKSKKKTNKTKNVRKNRGRPPP